MLLKRDIWSVIKEHLNCKHRQKRSENGIIVLEKFEKTAYQQQWLDQFQIIFELYCEQLSKFSSVIIASFTLIIINSLLKLSESVKTGTTSSHRIHLSAKQDYPMAETLPLPVNIDPTETMRFSPHRARDITSNAIATNVWNTGSIDITVDSSKCMDIKCDTDPHVGSYDCTGALSLSSAMQSNVPSPLGGLHKYTHLNMPGGQWSQSNKWMSHDLHSSHYTTLRREVRKDFLQKEMKATTMANSTSEKGIVERKTNDYLHGNLWMKMIKSNAMISSFACLYPNCHLFMPYHLHATSNQITHRMFSNKNYVAKTDEPNNEIVKNKKNPPIDTTVQNEKIAQNETETESVTLTPRAKLKNAIRDYGSTVLIFHIAISLVSLGIFYQLVNRYVVI